MRGVSERLVRKLLRTTEGRLGMWLSIVGLGATDKIASDVEWRGWVATGRPFGEVDRGRTPAGDRQLRPAECFARSSVGASPLHHVQSRSCEDHRLRL